MSRQLSESKVISEFAAQISEHVAHKVIRKLQARTDALLSGDDSPLRNAWDEICAQCQTSLSIYWDAYDETVCRFTTEAVSKLRPCERDAIWLQTPQALDWEFVDEESRDPNPVNDSDIANYVMQEYIYPMAGRWSNPRIAKYMEWSDSSD